MSKPDLDEVRAFLEERHRRLGERLAAWREREGSRLFPPDDDDAARRQARQLLRQLGDDGWMRWLIPPTHGGFPMAPDLRAACLVRETLASVSPLADAVYALQGLASMPITLAGSDEQKRRWLPALGRGEVMGAFAMTEPEVGSDAAALSTRAERLGDGWTLDGRKHLISNAGIADLYVVFAATSPEAGSVGVSAFLVPADTPGLRFLGAQVMSAPHPLGQVAFEGCRLPPDSLLGNEGEGFSLGMRTLDRLRATVAAAACGMARRALDEAIQHVRRRQISGRPLADRQLTQAKLATMATELAAARLLTYRAAWEADDGKDRVTQEAAMAKLFATEAAQRIVDAAVQLLGGRGVLLDEPVDLLYRSVRALRIYEGTSEIQQLVIARQLLRR